jgi:uncharacterized protein (DUF2252 family)
MDPGALARLAADPDARRAHIVEALADAFSDLIELDPRAFRRKFRKMAADPFAFYRGSAALFYADVAQLDDRWVDDRSRRVWIQGDLHAENYGTYMDASGILVFDVNDFDEAYLGHWTWDLQRMAASVVLLGYAKALSDETIRRLVRAYVLAYADQVQEFASEEGDNDFRITLEDAEDGTALRHTLLTARLKTRIDLLEATTAVEGHERHFADGPGVRRLDDDERAEVEAAFRGYLETVPADKRQHSVSYSVKDVVGRSGFGIGSAGLPAYNLLIEGRTQALENDVVLSMKQGNVPAPSRVVTDDDIAEAFEHQGHRTAVSQRALQARADPWLGWCELRGVGQVVQELSPYEEDLDWDELSEPEEMEPLIASLGRATAKVHCVSDADSDQTLVAFQVEQVVAEAVGGREEELADAVADFGAAYGSLARDDHVRFVEAFRAGEIPGVEAT